MGADEGIRPWAFEDSFRLEPQILSSYCGLAGWVALGLSNAASLVVLSGPGLSWQAARARSGTHPFREQRRVHVEPVLGLVDRGAPEEREPYHG